MTQIFVKYLLWLTLLTAALFGASTLLLERFPDFFVLPNSYITYYLLSFYTVSIASGYLVIRSSLGRGAVLVRSVMGSTILKFFLYIAVLSVFIVSVPGHSKEIGAYFFMFYVAFTVFEKTFLIKALSGSEK